MHSLLLNRDCKAIDTWPIQNSDERGHMTQIPTPAAQTIWCLPTPEGVPSRRARVHLGLNRAARYYQDLAVPGIGGVWFVRQISWACAGIKLREAFPRHLPSRLANAVEALACKHESKKEEPGRFRGTNAFKRYPDAWSFHQLSQSRYYVQITYRQTTVRALGIGGGLGFCQGSSRFNAMSLTTHGVELAEALLDQRNVGGSGSLESCLDAWIAGSEKHGEYPSVGQALSPLRVPKEKGTLDAEGTLVLARLLARAGYKDVDLSDPGRRERLLGVFEQLGALEGKDPQLEVVYRALETKGAKAQVARLKAALAFDVHYEHARSLVHDCAMALENKTVEEATVPDMAGWLGDQLAALTAGAREYRAAVDASGAGHPDAQALCVALLDAGDDADRLRAVLVREHNIVELRDDARKVGQGPLFSARQDLENEEDGEEDHDGETGLRSTRLRQLLVLWRNCHGIG